MNTKLLSNKELDDYVNEDNFDFLIKADAIKLFLENNPASLIKNKMIVLYGDWGSGKTSLMKHIEKTINRNIYFPIFFHAWEHEKDENLPLSLCDALINSLDSKNEAIKNFMKGAITTLKSFASGITLKSSGALSGLGVDFELSGEKIVKAIDEASAKPEKLSFYKSNKEFKESFREIEKLILVKYNAEKLLIFVDDLDRCEPENVLNLITALKLFFTYGDNTIYFSGVDKDAVSKAVKTKYNDIVKSEEYMEKVFDVSFNMPNITSLRKILLPYFYDVAVRDKTEKIYRSVYVIEDFFKSINFTNPRHIKKVLNKYDILKAFKSSNLPSQYSRLIPDIIVVNNNGQIFETIYCLFMIVLYEFSPPEFTDIVDYNNKFTQFVNLYYEIKNNTTSVQKSTIATELEAILFLENIHEMTFNQIIEKSGGNTGFARFLIIFSNSSPINIGNLPEQALERYGQYFTDNSISTNFCKFLIKYKDAIIYESKESYYIIGNLFKMARYLL